MDSGKEAGGFNSAEKAGKLGWVEKFYTSIYLGLGMGFACSKYLTEFTWIAVGIGFRLGLGGLYRLGFSMRPIGLCPMGLGFGVAAFAPLQEALAQARPKQAFQRCKS